VDWEDKAVHNAIYETKLNEEKSLAIASDERLPKKYLDKMPEHLKEKLDKVI
jgi:hypothetical protein